MTARLLSGMRPTGSLHLGHLTGVLENWVELQRRYDGFFMVADWHALMSEYEDPSRICANIVDNVTDWLAAGLDPERSIIFRQSDVPEHLELAMILSIMTPLGWVERVPTYKEQLREITGRDIATYGFLGYPVLQAADILLYKGNVVPVGEDQIPHLELTREIVRRFKHLTKSEIFPEPEPLLTTSAKLLGTDGRKMSKSYGNTIGLSDSPERIREVAQTMFTDPLRIKMSDPGHPESCNVCAYWKVFAPDKAERVWDECRRSIRGCSQNKRELADELIAYTDRFRAFRRAQGDDTRRERMVWRVLADGAQRARAVARATMAEVRQALAFHAPVKE